MKIQHCYVIPALFCRKDALCDREGVVQLVHVNRPGQIDAQHPPAVHVGKRPARTGTQSGEVGRADDAVGAVVKKMSDIPLSEGMVAQRDEIGARLKDRFRILHRNAVDVGGVFPVDDRKICAKTVTQPPELFAEIPDTASADDVAD